MQPLVAATGNWVAALNLGQKEPLAQQHSAARQYFRQATNGLNLPMFIQLCIAPVGVTWHRPSFWGLHAGFEHPAQVIQPLLWDRLTEQDVAFLMGLAAFGHG